MDKWITDFLARLVPQPIWDAINTAGALWDVWPWLVAAFVIGMIVGAWIGRWAVAGIIGAVVALMLLLRRGPTAVKEERAEVRGRRAKVAKRKKEVTRELSWVERIRLGL